MKNRKGFFYFKRLLGQNRARPVHTAHVWPTTAWPQHRTGLAGAGHMALAGRRAEVAHEPVMPGRV
jgi:hypothetical protein